MFKPDSDTDHIPAAAAPDAFGDLMALIRLIGDDKSYQKKLDALMAATLKANEAKAAAAKQEASLAGRLAAVERREAESRALQLEVHTEKQLIQGQRQQLSAYARHLGEIEDQIKMRILRHAGVLEHFNPDLQQLPEWAAIESSGRGDAHYDFNDSSARPESSDENEPSPDRVVGSNLTHRSPRPPKASRAEMVRGT